MSKKNEARTELRPAVESQQNKDKPFVVASTGTPSPLQGVSQMRLARIQQMQSDIAYLKMQLSEEWRLVRAELLGGAKVEKGPLRAWIKFTLRFGRGESIDTPRSKPVKTMMVR